VCESTHLDKLKEKTEKYKHLTSKQAATIAKKSKAKKLILTHFSQRYKSVEPLVKEAKSIFKNVMAAEDLMRLKV
jgi:ribonuclease Z